MMDSSNPSADTALRKLLERYAAEQLAKIPHDGSIFGAHPSLHPVHAAPWAIDGRCRRRAIFHE